MTDQKQIAKRVAREKEAHDGDDVLARAYALKDRFSHIWSVTDRVRKDENAILAQADGKRVLDYGCGRGEYSLELLSLGADVEGIDISKAYVDLCFQACRDHGIDERRFNFQVMDAHKLDFPDDSFDFVVGNGILHHLDYPTALSEIRRVLKPGGRAIFQEPLAGNPLLVLLRKLTPRARTEDERPFTATDLKTIADSWDVRSTYYGLLSAPVAMATSLLLKPWPNNPILTSATALEKSLSKLGLLQSWNQYVLFNLVKQNA